MLPDDGDVLRRRDVIARFPVVVGFHIEAFGEKLFAVGEAVAATHEQEHRGAGTCARDVWSGFFGSKCASVRSARDVIGRGEFLEEVYGVSPSPLNRGLAEVLAP